jgi:type IV secretory pathway TrbD component
MVRVFKTQEHTMSQDYIKLLTPAERLATLKIGAAKALEKRGLGFADGVSGTGKILAGIGLLAVAAGVPLGVIAHKLQVSGIKRSPEERELYERARLYRDYAIKAERSLKR